MSEDNVIGFPSKARPTSEQILQIVPRWKIGACRHERFIVDPPTGKVSCADCKEPIDPIHALVTLADSEGKFRRFSDTYREEMKRLGERSKTKCQNCGQMTRISRK